MFSYINSVILCNIFVLTSCISMSFSGCTGHVRSDVSVHLLTVFNCQQIGKEIFLQRSLITMANSGLFQIILTKAWKVLEIIFLEMGSVTKVLWVWGALSSPRNHPCCPACHHPHATIHMMAIPAAGASEGTPLQSRAGNVRNNAPGDTRLLLLPRGAHWRKGSGTDFQGFKA